MSKSFLVLQSMISDASNQVDLRITCKLKPYIAFCPQVQSFLDEKGTTKSGPTKTMRKLVDRPSTM